ncbi:hypothetical protein K490DRAFT_65162 [Saccharata proteae CBS 121410]|uniref:Uncharacterized protein n=1 Tax=Saccharata proteae CBS 121410 TaxID=1314787 RepID=A0A9P4LXP0_9PEZI|nr:hypothetical protein K490DRAFT_65162 [Saccharata proteae CBS 121410]
MNIASFPTFSVDASVSDVLPNLMPSFISQDTFGHPAVPVATEPWWPLPTTAEPIAMDERPTMHLPVVAVIVPQEAQAYEAAGWRIAYDVCSCGCIPAMVDSENGLVDVRSARNSISSPSNLDPSAPAFIASNDSRASTVLNPEARSWNSSNFETSAFEFGKVAKLNPDATPWIPDSAMPECEVQIKLVTPAAEHETDSQTLPYQNASQLSPWFHVRPFDNKFRKPGISDQRLISTPEAQSVELGNVEDVEGEHVVSDIVSNTSDITIETAIAANVILGDEPALAVQSGLSHELDKMSDNGNVEAAAETTEEAAGDDVTKSITQEEAKPDVQVEFASNEFQWSLEEDEDTIIVVRDGRMMIVPASELDEEESSGSEHSEALPEDNFTLQEEAVHEQEAKDYWRNMNVDLLPAIPEEEVSTEEAATAQTTPESSISTSMVSGNDILPAPDFVSDDETLPSPVSSESTSAAKPSTGEIVADLPPTQVESSHIEKSRIYNANSAPGTESQAIVPKSAHKEASASPKPISNLTLRETSAVPTVSTQTARPALTTTPSAQTAAIGGFTGPEATEPSGWGRRRDADEIRIQWESSCKLYPSENRVRVAKPSDAPTKPRYASPALNKVSQPLQERSHGNKGAAAKTSPEARSLSKPEGFGKLAPWVKLSSEEAQRQWRISSAIFRKRT